MSFKRKYHLLRQSISNKIRNQYKDLTKVKYYLIEKMLADFFTKPL